MTGDVNDSTHSDKPPHGPVVVEAGQGESLGQVGATTSPTTIMGRASWSEGHVLILDQVVAPGTFVGAHHHTVEAQGAYITAGTLGFWVDGEEVIAGPGTYVVRPAGSIHALWNPGEVEARMLEITTPAERFQELMLRLRDLRAQPHAGPDEIAALAQAYGTFPDDDVSAALTAKLGLETRQVGLTR